jgi:hypothetical protein
MFAALSLVAGLPGVFGFITKNWKLMLGIVAAIAFVLFVWAWDAKIKEAAILQQQNAILQGNITVLHQEADLSNQAHATAEARLAAAAQANLKIDRIAQEAAHARSQDDGPLAAVLSNTLSLLGSLQRDATPAR